MKLRIRTKFIGILLLAAVLPLGLALVVAETLGFRYHQRAQGRLLQTRAEDLAHSLGLAVSAQLASLDDWIALSALPARVAAAEAAGPRLTDAEFKRHIDDTEALWPSLTAETEPLRGFLQNEIAGELRAFQTIHPHFVELFATDARGQILGATEKTTDYWQADEAWWQRGFEQRFNHVYVEGIHYDDSARVYSVDVSAPIRDWRHPGEPPAGVVKGVLNASPLLSSVAPALSGDAAVYQVVLGDGRILAQLTGRKVEPLKERIPAAAAAQLQQKRSGWMLTPLAAGEPALAGHAPVRLNDALGEDLAVTGLTPMNVLVFNSAAVVFAPARKEALVIGGAGTLLILASAFLGYWLTGKKIIDPLEALRTATRAIAATAKLGDAAPEPRALPALEPIRRIRTGDELQELAHEFEYMAGRVLTYSERARDRSRRQDRRSRPTCKWRANFRRRSCRTPIRRCPAARTPARSGSSFTTSTGPRVPWAATFSTCSSSPIIAPESSSPMSWATARARRSSPPSCARFCKTSPARPATPRSSSRD